LALQHPNDVSCRGVPYKELPLVWDPWRLSRLPDLSRPQIPRQEPFLLPCPALMTSLTLLCGRIIAIQRPEGQKTPGAPQRQLHIAKEVYADA
jgi:hypothetical protein